MRLGTASVIRGNARTLPLPDDSVDLIVTSPPYFALRSYQDGGEHYAGQIGSEPTPQEFLDALIECTREWVRVLKPSGSLFVNLGDKYAGGGGQWDKDERELGFSSASRNTSTGGKTFGFRRKSLMGLPWRYAIRCVDDLGLILRAEVIWSKPNGLPESVTDRVRRSHEQWFHFTLQPRYFSAVDEIREAQQSVGERHEGRSGWVNAAGKAGGDEVTRGFTTRALNPLGKLPGSVWTVPTEPLRVPESLGIDHFAAFPTEWPKRIVQGWSPGGICTACGEGRRPVVAAQRCIDGYPADIGARKIGGYQSEPSGIGNWRVTTEREHLGYACACQAPTIQEQVTEFDYGTGSTVERTVEVPDPAWRPTAPTRPAVVLDPFGGTGTTAMVAKALGRHGISVDLSADYCRLAEWRTNDRDQLAKVLGVGKAEQQPAEQLDLFGGAL